MLQEVLLLPHAQVQLLPLAVPPDVVLPHQVLQAQLLRSRADLLRSRCPDLLRSRTGLCSDLRCSRRCCLQLVVELV